MFKTIDNAIEDMLVTAMYCIKQDAKYTGEFIGTIMRKDITKDEYESLPFFARSWFKYDEATGTLKRDTFNVALDSVLFVLVTATVVLAGLWLFANPIASATVEIERWSSIIVNDVTETRHAVGDYLATFEWSHVASDLASVSESVIHSVGDWLAR